MVQVEEDDESDLIKEPNAEMRLAQTVWLLSALTRFRLGGLIKHF